MFWNNGLNQSIKFYFSDDYFFPFLAYSHIDCNTPNDILDPE